MEEAVRKFQGTESSIRFLGGYYRNVYEYERDGETCVIKLFPVAGRDRGRLLAELKWMSFLKSRGIPVPKNILSARGQSVETILRLPVPCYIVSFRKVNGKPVDPTHKSVWNSGLFRRWGNIMGQIHALSRNFLRREGTAAFDEWDEGELFHRDLSFIESRIVDRFSSMLQRIRTFPKSDRSYGLIHNDLHHRGFLLAGSGNLTPVDFGRVKRHFFTYDIAIALHHAMEETPEELRDSFREEFLRAFMEGYLLENELEDHWREQVDFFLEYRLFHHYLQRMACLDADRTDERELAHIREIRNRLLSMRPATLR
ncbi:phosphotransferase enzyme family protein [Staphylospora marina]|uniref:phosphotransferase enzyme family protein n=1 Tax=Staphylospora marina TaxID=2490858 RepID=UPI0013DDA9DC|nr:phosphotransferase [Staphylospora marina]